MCQSELEEMAKQERKAYMKEWRAANKDKVKKHQQTYWQKKAQQRADAEKSN